MIYGSRMYSEQSLYMTSYNKLEYDTVNKMNIVQCMGIVFYIVPWMGMVFSIYLTECIVNGHLYDILQWMYVIFDIVPWNDVVYGIVQWMRYDIVKWMYVVYDFVQCMCVV